MLNHIVVVFLVLANLGIMIVDADVAGISTVVVGTIILQTMSAQIIVVVVVVGSQGFSDQTVLHAIVVVPKVVAVVGSLLGDCLLDPVIHCPRARVDSRIYGMCASQASQHQAHLHVLLGGGPLDNKHAISVSHARILAGVRCTQHVSCYTA